MERMAFPERLRDESMGQCSAPRSEARADPDVLRLAEEVSEKVGAKVSIRPGRKGSGKLVVEYATLDQLDNLIAALSGRQ